MQRDHGCYNSSTIGIVAIGKTLSQDLRELHPGRVRDSCMDNDGGLDAGIGKKVTLLPSFTDHRATDRGNNLAEGDSQLVTQLTFAAGKWRNGVHARGKGRWNDYRVCIGGKHGFIGRCLPLCSQRIRSFVIGH